MVTMVMLVVYKLQDGDVGGDGGDEQGQPRPHWWR